MPPDLMMGEARLKIARRVGDPPGPVDVSASSRHASSAVGLRLDIDAVPFTGPPVALCRWSAAAETGASARLKMPRRTLCRHQTSIVRGRTPAPARLSGFFTPRRANPAMLPKNGHGGTDCVVPPCRRVRWSRTGRVYRPRLRRRARAMPTRPLPSRTSDAGSGTPGGGGGGGTAGVTS